MTNRRYDTVKSYLDSIHRFQKANLELNKSAMTRFVWFVGISGFIILNSNTYWEALKGKPLTAIEISLFSVPFIFTIFSSIRTHFQTDELIAANNNLYQNVVALFELQLLDIAEDKENPQTTVDLIEGIYPEDVQELEDKARSQSEKARRGELISYWSLLVGFLVSIIAPVVLRFLN